MEDVVGSSPTQGTKSPILRDHGTETKYEMETTTLTKITMWGNKPSSGSKLIKLTKMSRNKYNKCLVLDQNYMAKSIITTDRAFVIAYKGNAEVIHDHPVTFGLVNPDLKIHKPSIIRVPNYIDHHQNAPLSRANIFKRDNYECAYCPPGSYTPRGFLTLDHILPQARGGKNTWENLVTACLQCNQLKADLLVEEFTKEVPEPKRPHYLMLMQAAVDIKEEWKPYLLFAK